MSSEPHSSFPNETSPNSIIMILCPKQIIQQNSVSHSSSVFEDVSFLWLYFYQLPSMSDRWWCRGLGHTLGSLMLGLN